MQFEKKSCWTILKINTYKNSLDIETINNIEKKIEDFEQKYSRFFLGNYLNKLNKSWKSSIDEEFKTLFRVCKNINLVSKWHFDITILPFLENLWYWIEKDKLKQNFWMENIKFIDDIVILKNDVKIDFWAIWKWYLVDCIYHILKKKIDDFTIDFWWDLKVWNQKETVWLEDPFDDKKIIWEIVISDESICSSNWQKRKFWDNHHLISPLTKKSQNDKIAVYIKHKSATLADWYSTALFVSPINISLEILEKTRWLEWMIIWKNWEVYKSIWFDAKLFE